MTKEEKTNFETDENGGIVFTPAVLKGLTQKVEFNIRLLGAIGAATGAILGGAAGGWLGGVIGGLVGAILGMIAGFFKAFFEYFK